MIGKNGIFTLSLDFELYWGVRDKREISAYRNNLLGVKQGIEHILELFEKYEVHATWATVGLLFAKNAEELQNMFPEDVPNYSNKNLSPYNYINSNKVFDPDYHFAPDLIDKISRHKNQEIGTHTLSHYYCLEPGQTAQEFKSDINAARAIAKAHNIRTKSLVFPRNQWNAEYLSVLNECEILAYRGNEKGWIYKAIEGAEETPFRRALRLADSYIHLSGHNVYNLKSINHFPPYNIPSSRFLRPYSKRLAPLDGLRKRRIVRSLKHAAKRGLAYHLWWHPHNFGTNLEKNISFLEAILVEYSKCRKEYGMMSLNMGEIGDQIRKSEQNESC